MNILKEIQVLTLVMLTEGAFLHDTARQTVPNGWILLGLFLGFWYQMLTGGIWGIGRYLGGVFLPILVLGLLFYCRMIGAGDIKLFCVIGGLTGGKECMNCIILAFLLGAVFSLILIWKRKNAVQRFFYLKEYIQNWIETREWKPYLKETNEDAKFCFTLPILLAVLYQAWIPR